MGNFTIQITLQNGLLYYQDQNNPVKKTTITSHINAGSKIFWEAKNGSGISEITGIAILNATEGYITDGPKQVNTTKWSAEIGKVAKGSASYEIRYIAEKQKSTLIAAATDSSGGGTSDTDPPDLRTP